MSEQLTDFNDLHVAAGLDAVKRQLLSVLTDARGSFEGVESNNLPPEPPSEIYDQENKQDFEQAGRNEDWANRLDRTEKGVIRPHVGNLELILLNDPRWDGVLSYCDFSYRIVFRKQAPIQSQLGEWTDADAARLRTWFHRAYFMPPPPRAEIVDAILIAAQRHRFHPVRLYLEKLRWDGVDRLDFWLKDAFKSPAPDKYLSIIGPKFLIGSVARVMNPGCKMDNVLILEGEQGRGKSTAVAILYGDWFSDAPLPIGDKDAYQTIQGVWGAELAELDSFNKSESTSAKAFFSQIRDRYRPSYGHNAQDFPRQTVFLGTTNQDEYLKDYSGNRRYWPILCKEVNTEWMRKNRDQLWAEAFHRYKAGDTWWIFGDEERETVEREQDSRLMRDVWEDRLREFLAANSAEWFSAYELLTQAIGFDAPHIQRAHQNRIAPIMKALGWKKQRRRVPDSITGKVARIWVYCRPDSDPDAPFQGGEE